MAGYLINLADTMKQLMFMVLLTVLTGCQHIQLVNQPLPFKVDNTTQPTKQTDFTPNTHPAQTSNNQKTSSNEAFFILEDWF